MSPNESQQIKQDRYYVTTPIYYVNARPHIGHAYTTIVADVLARRQRLLLGKDNVHFLTGTDEHGQKIERSAAAAGIPPQQFADQVSAQFRSLWDRMGLTYDDYIRTTEPRHKLGAQKLFAELYQRGAIYLSSYTGQYCVSEEIFVEGPPGTIGPDGKPTETVTEENFFFKLSEYQLPLIDLIESDRLAITPESRKNEVLSFLRGNVVEARERGDAIAHSAGGIAYVPGTLRDLSVSRSSFSWGIPVPEPAASATEKKHVMYVWLDALANYMTAVGYGTDTPEANAMFAKFWPADVHIMAKEITRQHCIYWPAFLLAANLSLPKAVTAHGWLLFDNSKMSKSKGNIVRSETILDAFGDHVYGKQFPDSSKTERDLFAADVMRYFLLREIPFGQDGSFSFDAMVTRYNADLANGYGNLVSRTLNMINQYFGEVPSYQPPQGSAGWNRKQWLEHLYKISPTKVFWSDRESENVSGAGPQVMDIFNQASSLHSFLEIKNSIVLSGPVARMQALIAITDRYISNNAPWKLAKVETAEARGQLEEVLYSTVEAVRIITTFLYPVLPNTTAKVWAQLGLGSIEEAAARGELNNLQWGGLKPGTKLGPLAPIFPRAEKGLVQIMTDMEASNAAASTPIHETRPETPLKDAATPTPAIPVPTDSTHPGAPARTSSLTEPNAHTQVAGSSAPVPELHKPPSHTEAPASAPFTATESTQITIDDFIKVELRVAQILVAERIPKADKLLRLEVDLGYEKRQILSGIAEWYTPEELIGRRIVIVANLAPRKMRGLESHGMLLAASAGDHGKPVLTTFGEDIELGSRVR